MRVPRCCSQPSGLLDQRDQEVTAVGGRLDRAKDARRSKETGQRATTRLASWDALRIRLDPQPRLQSYPG
jgi:hypothetical protein